MSSRTCPQWPRMAQDPEHEWQHSTRCRGKRGIRAGAVPPPPPLTTPGGSSSSRQRSRSQTAYTQWASRPTSCGTSLVTSDIRPRVSPAGRKKLLVWRVCRSKCGGGDATYPLKLREGHWGLVVLPGLQSETWYGSGSLREASDTRGTSSFRVQRQSK